LPVKTTESAVRAAVAAARDQGIHVTEPRVVRDLTNVLVHLAPAPIIARVPITLARLRPPSWFAREVEVASFLAAAGAPVAPPARDVDPGPHMRDGLVVSLWQLVDHDPARFDAATAGGALRDLHLALADYPGELPRCERLVEVRRLLDTLEPSTLAAADELDGLGRVCDRLAGEELPVGRPIHGDSHFRNLLWTAEGPLWTDLENACTGPVEYDLACLAWRADPGTREALTAYGAYDEHLVETATPHLALFLAAWTIVVVARAPSSGGIAEARRRVRRALEYAG
jgi:hypothetical protein